MYTAHHRTETAVNQSDIEKIANCLEHLGAIRNIVPLYPPSAVRYIDIYLYDNASPSSVLNELDRAGHIVRTGPNLTVIPPRPQLTVVSTSPKHVTLESS